jgi:alanine racemase
MTEAGTRPPIEDRLSAAGLPGLPRTAWLEIDLDAIRHNLALVRGLAGVGVPVRPVVKADAYGHGAIPVATALEAAGADGFCVAAFDEAMELRDGGVRAPILVLYPPPPDWAGDAARAGIAIAAGDLAALGAVVRAAGRPAAPDRALAIELEVETGLGRGGLEPGDLIVAAALIARSPGVRLAGLWTHFQAVEDPDITAGQIARFEAAVHAVAAAGIALPPRHAAASAALMTDGVVAYDGVRPGLALYGIAPDELGPGGAGRPASGLRPAMALYARPVRVATLPAGWGISYGPTFRTQRESRIATLPLGYGDGWSRALSNRASAIVRGRRVPLVGNVAMDAVMADVTDVPGRPVDASDEFVLMGADGGERISALDLARVRTTNTWEVVTGMARRLPRVYHAAAGPVGLRTLTGQRG